MDAPHEAVDDHDQGEKLGYGPRRIKWKSIDYRAHLGQAKFDDSPEVKYEMVNIAAITEIADHPALRRMVLSNGDHLMRNLADIARRAKHGRIAVVWQDIEDVILRCKSRRYSGLNHIAAVPCCHARSHGRPA